MNRNERGHLKRLFQDGVIRYHLSMRWNKCEAGCAETSVALRKVYDAMEKEDTNGAFESSECTDLMKIFMRREATKRKDSKNEVHYPERDTVTTLNLNIARRLLSKMFFCTTHNPLEQK